jgi:hypothetical protein
MNASHASVEISTDTFLGMHFPPAGSVNVLGLHIMHIKPKLHRRLMQIIFRLFGIETIDVNGCNEKKLSHTFKDGALPSLASVVVQPV